MYHLQSLKVQTIDTFNSDKERKMIIKESNSFRGIPYADYFNVNTEWIITSVQNSAADEKDRSMCHVSIHLDFTFHKSTWLQGTIESNTKAELIGVFELWRSAAEFTIKQMAQTAAAIAARDKESSNLNIIISGDDVMDFNNDEINMLSMYRCYIVLVLLAHLLISFVRHAQQVSLTGRVSVLDGIRLGRGHGHDFLRLRGGRRNRGRGGAAAAHKAVPQQSQQPQRRTRLQFVLPQPELLPHGRLGLESADDAPREWGS
jgi:hypothetical protein